jgi:hypothetical protein
MSENGAAEVMWLRDAHTGRLVRELFGSTPLDQVPADPYYRPSPGSRLSVDAWLDDDGQHVVIAHDCVATREVHILPWPTWQANGSDITPSYSCDDCGVHCFATVNRSAASVDGPQ